MTARPGKWWDRVKPDPFTAHDLYPLDGVDFRALPEADSSVDAVCFDPPYVLSGGVSTSTAGAFLDNYGIGTKRTGGTRALEALILGGLTECIRVANRWVLVKCMEFSQGNHVPAAQSFHDIPRLVTDHARSLGCGKHDQIVHFTGTGPGGHNIWEAKRCRRAHSYLLVFEVPR